jgi:hypothetical protein
MFTSNGIETLEDHQNNSKSAALCPYPVPVNTEIQVQIVVILNLFQNLDPETLQSGGRASSG